MAVVENLDVKEGDIVLDLCAAPGGKSTQIACALNSTGLLISNEIISSRAKILSQNVERCGVRNCVVINESPKTLSQRFCGIFDKILVDAPCSGEGMFRKNPSAIEEWSIDNVRLCKERQLDILDDAVTSARQLTCSMRSAPERIRRSLSPSRSAFSPNSSPLQNSCPALRYIPISPPPPSFGMHR